MENKILFKVNTIMKKEDYRKFLYLATFKRNPIIIPMILLIAAAGAAILSFENGKFNPASFLMDWAFMASATFGAICLKVERKNKKRIQTDKMGTFDSYQTIEFYEDYIITYNKEIEGSSKIRYDQFYGVLESKDYFIFYYTENLASLIRKKDLEDICLPEIRDLIKSKIGQNFSEL